MDLLRLLTCGSVDDGKSTLIGRLLHDSSQLPEDRLAAVFKESATSGHAGGQLDLALLADGLRAEREQGITIDVAHLYFSTGRRSFIIADTPGHVQYTRNMVTGASTAALAVILVDASRGTTNQTRRHTTIVSLLRIPAVVMAINKMDLVDYREAVFTDIVTEVTEMAQALELSPPVCIPMSALNGDGVVERGNHMSWYQGPCLLEHLEQVNVTSAPFTGQPPVTDQHPVTGQHQSAKPPPGTEQQHQQLQEEEQQQLPQHQEQEEQEQQQLQQLLQQQQRLRLPVQLIIRPDHRFRGYAGTIREGTLRVGDRVRVEPSGHLTDIERIVTFDGDLTEAGPGRAVTVTTSDEIDISRGDLIVDPVHPPHRSQQVTATLVWMSHEVLVTGREYLLEQGGQSLSARVSQITSRLDFNTLKPSPASTLELNDIARVEVHTDSELVFDSYAQNRSTGSFILIDRASLATVAAGMIETDLPTTAWDTEPRPTVERQRSSVSTTERAERLGQRPATILVTGLTGAGKSTIARALERELFDRGHVTVRLDGENMRLGVSKDLGFSGVDRSENVRRTAELARLLNDQGLITIAALVAPDAEVRERARELLGTDRFVEVFLDTPLSVCRSRDTTGLYEAALRGELRGFPGVSAPYDKPTDADLVLDTSKLDVEACVEAVMAWLQTRLFI